MHELLELDPRSKCKILSTRYEILTCAFLLLMIVILLSLNADSIRGSDSDIIELQSVAVENSFDVDRFTVSQYVLYCSCVHLFQLRPLLSPRSSTVALDTAKQRKIRKEFIKNKLSNSFECSYSPMVICGPPRNEKNMVDPCDNITVTFENGHVSVMRISKMSVASLDTWTTSYPFVKEIQLLDIPTSKFSIDLHHLECLEKITIESRCAYIDSIRLPSTIKSGTFTNLIISEVHDCETYHAIHNNIELIRTTFVKKNRNEKHILTKVPPRLLAGLTLVWAGHKIYMFRYLFPDAVLRSVCWTLQIMNSAYFKKARHGSTIHSLEGSSRYVVKRILN